MSGIYMRTALFFALVLPSFAGEFYPVDLSNEIHRPWGSFQPFTDWTLPAGGRQTFDNVPFEIGGVVQIIGMEHAAKGNVRSVRKTFAVNRVFTQLHLLHYTEFSSTFGQPVVMVWLHYDDGGEPYSYPLRFGVDCMDWYHSPPASATGKSTTCPWMAAPASSRSRQVTGLWHTRVPNPNPARSVKSIEIHSMFAKSTYGLVALTIEAGQPQTILEDKAPPSRRFPQIAMPTSRWLQFKDDATRQPVPHAKASIALRDGDRSIPWGDHTADAQGKLSILLPPWWHYALEIVAAAPNHAATYFSLEDDFEKGTNDVAELKLKRGKTIGGIVRDSSGAIVSNATLSILSVEGDSKRGFSLYNWPLTKTDGRGRWSAAANDTLRGLEFRISHPGFLLAEYELGDPQEREPWIVSASQLLKSEASMTLSNGVMLRGHVLDDTQRPVTNASIACFAAGEVIAQRRVKTDTSGQFSIGPLERATVALIVSAPQHAPALIRTRLDEASAKLDVKLRPAAPLRLKVQGPGGQPLRDAYLVLVDWHELRWLGSMLQSNDDGIIVFPEAPADNAKYLLTLPGMTSEILTLLAGGDNIVATLKPLTRR